LSVIPPQIRHTLDVVVHPEPNWTDPVPDWCGVPCRIGRVELWLPIVGLAPLRPFSLLVLLPVQSVSFQPPFIHLGIQFFIEYGASLLFDCSSASATSSWGRVVIP
jgi:hypothetical protein